MAVNFASAINAYANASRIGAQAAGASGANAAASGGSGFGDLLRSAVDNAVDAVKSGEQASMQAVTGKADLAQVTAAVSNAQVAVQTVVAVRDRVVQAYQDIIKMPM